MKKDVKYHETPELNGETIGTLREVAEPLLPSPEEFARQSRKVKISINLSQESVDAFKLASRRTGSPYQVLIRQVLDAYARQISRGRG